MVPMELPELGTTFQSKYRLDRVLGEGGFARVYEAEDVGAQRIVALKILKPDDHGYARDVESRFHREVRVVANLRDPHTVTMFDFGRSPEGLLFMVFEYVPGQDLTQVLEARGPLGDDATIHILRQVLQSLREAHQGGLLHRDIKPANIRISEYMGDPLRVTLLDFGIAKPLVPSAEGSAITHSGSLVGTPQYMSPEQLLEQQLTPASDVYSLGLVAYEMLSGMTAIKGNSLSDQLVVLGGAGLALPPNAPVSPGLRRIVDRMISRDPAMRLQTAEQVLRSLEALARGVATADISIDESRRSATGSQPLHAHPGYQGPQPPSGSQPLSAPSGSQPLAWDRSGDSLERLAYVPPTHQGSGVHQVPPADSELSTPMLIGALVVILLCLGLVVSAGVKLLGDSGPTEPEIRTIVLPPSHSGSSIDPTPPVPAPKAAPVKDDKKVGCGHPAKFLGEGDIAVGDTLDPRSIRVYVPVGYDPKASHPLIVVFHDIGQQASSGFERLQLAELADRENAVVVMPNSTELELWRRPTNITQAYRDVTRVRENFCIDDSRIYGFGHGAGGRAATQMACHFPGVAAIATTAFRTEPREKPCTKNPVPYLHIAMLNDAAAPERGGAACGAGRSLSVSDYEDLYIKAGECGVQKLKWRSHKYGDCSTWTCSRAKFTSCRVRGGREWPGAARTPPDAPLGLGVLGVNVACDGKPVDFPYADTIWDFFEQEAPGTPEK